MDLLVGKHLGKRFGDREILNDFNISIQEGVNTAFAGATGSGKSTLLKILAGLMEPDQGQVLFDGQHVEGPLTKLIPGHDRIAFLSQYFELRNNYRIEEIFDYSNQLENDQAKEIFKICQVDHLLKRRTDQLSGGERQRVALTRVLLTKPRILLLDEPFSNLDLIQKTSLKNVLSAITASFQLTTVLVSHDASDILSFADIIHVMKEGRIIQSGSANDIYYHPKDKYVAGLFGLFTEVSASLRKLFATHRLLIDDNVHFLRPEMFSIVPLSNESLHVTVENNLFMGSFWQAKLSIDGHSLFCYHHDPHIREGSKVGILFALPVVGTIR